MTAGLVCRIAVYFERYSCKDKKKETQIEDNRPRRKTTNKLGFTTPAMTMSHAVFVHCKQP
jgi:hypothetical protein